MPRFDWYQCTLDDDPDHVLENLCRGLDMASVRPCRGINSYLRGAEVYRSQDRPLARVYWGGNPGTHVLISGADCPEVVPVLRRYHPSHRVTRLDVCEDFEAPSFFNDITKELIDFAIKNDLTIDTRGDWERGKARTLYIGAAESAVRLVVYEKGYEQGQGDSRPYWVRVEARLRPQGADSRSRLALKSPKECLGAGWLPHAFDYIDWLEVEPLRVGKVWRSRDTDRARLHLVKQYAGTLTGWAEELGSWEELGRTLSRLVAEPEAKERLRILLDS